MVCSTLLETSSPASSSRSRVRSASSAPSGGWRARDARVRARRRRAPASSPRSSRWDSPPTKRASWGGVDATERPLGAAAGVADWTARHAWLRSRLRPGHKPCSWSGRRREDSTTRPAFLSAPRRQARLGLACRPAYPPSTRGQARRAGLPETTDIQRSSSQSSRTREHGPVVDQHHEPRPRAGAAAVGLDERAHAGGVDEGRRGQIGDEHLGVAVLAEQRPTAAGRWRGRARPRRPRWPPSSGARRRGRTARARRERRHAEHLGSAGFTKSARERGRP